MTLPLKESELRREWVSEGVRELFIFEPGALNPRIGKAAGLSPSSPSYSVSVVRSSLRWVGIHGVENSVWQDLRAPSSYALLRFVLYNNEIWKGFQRERNLSLCINENTLVVVWYQDLAVNRSFTSMMSEPCRIPSHVVWFLKCMHRMIRKNWVNSSKWALTDRPPILGYRLCLHLLWSPSLSFSSFTFI